jgi:hypothetical protein
MAMCSFQEGTIEGRLEQCTAYRLMVLVANPTWLIAWLSLSAAAKAPVLYFILLSLLGWIAAESIRNLRSFQPKCEASERYLSRVDVS